MSGNVSFRISNNAASQGRFGARRRSRSQSSGSSDGDDDDGGRSRGGSSSGMRRRDESITGVDRHGIRSSNAPKREKPLVIPALPNKDFRRAAIELRAKKEGRTAFLPGQATLPGSGAGAGSDEARPRRELTEAERAFLESNSNVQRVGNGVVTGGIRQRQPQQQQNADRGDATPIYESSSTTAARTGSNGANALAENGASSNTNDVVMQDATTTTASPAAGDAATRPSGMSGAPDLDADALALQELLASNSDAPAAPKVTIIPARPELTEDEAYAIDVEARPDGPTLDDYARVPIEDFGAALLRGMAASNPGKKRERVEAYVPKARTALLGIGAKSREETFGPDLTVGPGNAKKKLNKREEMKFMPLQRVRKADGASSTNGTVTPATGTSEGSRSPLPLAPSAQASTSRLAIESFSSTKMRGEDVGSEGKRSRRTRHEEEYDSSDRRERKRREVDDSPRRRDDERRSRRRYSDDEEESEEERRRRRKRREKERDWDRDPDRDGYRDSGRDRPRERERRRDDDDNDDRRRRRDLSADREKDSRSSDRRRERERERERGTERRPTRD